MKVFVLPTLKEFVANNPGVSASELARRWAIAYPGDAVTRQAFHLRLQAAGIKVPRLGPAPPKRKTCPKCKKVFEARRHRWYCSPECLKASQQGRSQVERFLPTNRKIVRFQIPPSSERALRRVTKSVLSVAVRLALEFAQLSEEREWESFRPLDGDRAAWRSATAKVPRHLVSWLGGYGKKVNVEGILLWAASLPAFGEWAKRRQTESGQP